MTTSRSALRILAGLALVTAGCNFGKSSESPDAGSEGGTITDALLSVSATIETFPTTAVGQSSAPVTLIITNTGTGRSGVMSRTLSGGDASSFVIDQDGCNGTTLDAGATCSMKMHFAPTSAGAEKATLGVVGQPGGAVTVSLAGTAIGAGLAWTPASQAFGPTAPGSTSQATTFTLTNSGASQTGMLSVSVAGTDAAQFPPSSDTCSKTTLAAGAKCTVDVAFAPTSTGGASATLQVVDAAATGMPTTAALTGTVASGAVFGVAPPAYDFGSFTVGNASPHQSFTVTNSGGSPATAGVAVLGTNATDFALSASSCTGMLAPMATCSFLISFTPSTAGAESATLSIAGTGATSTSAALTGTGLAAAALAIGPATQDFGTVAQGASSMDFPFSVTNNGGVASGPLAVSFGGSSASLFQLGAQTCDNATLGANGSSSCSIHVHFSPTAGTTGAVTASLLVAGTPGGTAVATLTGNVTSAASLALTPSPFGFGPQPQGTPTSPVTFTVTNAGGSNSGTPAFTQGGPNAADFVVVTNNCTTAVPGSNGTCTLSVVFTPSTQAAESSTLTVTATPGGTSTATLSGTGEAPAAIGISPSPFDYQNVVQATATPPTQTFTVTNSGGVATSIPVVTQGGSGDFAITSNGCTQAIPSLGSCPITVAFDPSALGPESSTLTVSATTGGTATATLSGTGVTPALLSVSPNPGSLGPVTIGKPANATFEVSNTGGSPTSAVSVSLSPSPGDFSYTTTCGAVIAPSTTNACTVTVTFVPTSTSESARLTVSATDGGTVPVPLTGTGLTVAAFSLTTNNAGGSAFGGVTYEQSSTIQYWLSNTGETPSDVPQIDLSGSSDFSYTSDCPTTAGIPASTNDACSIDVTFIPSTTGSTENASLTVSAASGGTAGPVLFSGYGLTVADLQLVASGPFGTVNDGSSSQVTYQVSNLGQSASGTTAGAYVSGGTNQNDFVITGNTCGASIPASTSNACAITVTFTPTTGNTETSTLYVPASPGGPATASLSGTGVVLVGSISLSPAGLYGFGAAANVASSAFPFPTLTYTVSNGGTGPTKPLAIGGMTNGFSVQSSECASAYPSGLPSGQECTFVVQFQAPLSVTPGTTVQSDITVTDTSTDTQTAQGQAIVLSDTYYYVISPDPWDYASGAARYRSYGVTNYGIENGADMINVISSARTVFVVGNTSACVGTLTPVVPGPYPWECGFGVTFVPPTSPPSGSTGTTVIVNDTNGVNVDLNLTGEWP
jgi:hypothetical protein